jgi:hypothetical protein
MKWNTVPDFVRHSQLSIGYRLSFHLSNAGETANVVNSASRAHFERHHRHILTSPCFYGLSSGRCRKQRVHDSLENMFDSYLTSDRQMSGCEGRELVSVVFGVGIRAGSSGFLSTTGIRAESGCEGCCFRRQFSSGETDGHSICHRTGSDGCRSYCRPLGSGICRGITAWCVSSRK